MLTQCCTQSHGVQLPGLGVGLTLASFRPQLADDWNDPPAPSCQDARAGSCHPFWGTCRHPGLPPLIHVGNQDSRPLSVSEL